VRSSSGRTGALGAAVTTRFLEEGHTVVATSPFNLLLAGATFILFGLAVELSGIYPRGLAGS
jgi:hypothetical protein